MIRPPPRFPLFPYPPLFRPRADRLGRDRVDLGRVLVGGRLSAGASRIVDAAAQPVRPPAGDGDRAVSRRQLQLDRSEEHTSELQSPCNLVCRLLLEKKKENQ